MHFRRQTDRQTDGQHRRLESPVVSWCCEIVGFKTGWKWLPLYVRFAKERGIRWGRCQTRCLERPRSSCGYLPAPSIRSYCWRLCATACRPARRRNGRTSRWTDWHPWCWRWARRQGRPAARWRWMESPGSARSRPPGTTSHMYGTGMLFTAMNRNG